MTPDDVDLSAFAAHAAAKRRLPPPGRRSRRLWLLAAVPPLLCGLVLAVCGPPAVLTQWWGQRQGEPEPTVSQPDTEHVRVLGQQAAALVDGDEAGWLAAVDPTNVTLVEQYRAMFRNLRGLGVTRYSINPGKRDELGEVAVTIEYCLTSGQCCVTDTTCKSTRPDAFIDHPRTRHLVTLQRRNGRMYVTGVKLPEPDGRLNQPSPWEVTPLVFASGQRTTIAAPSTLAAQLPTYLAEAEKAATYVDTYARWGNKPRRYLIYLADDQLFAKTWFGGPTDKEIGGYALTGSNGLQYEIVLKVPIPPQHLALVLRHEMGHVATLNGVHRAPDAPWLREGIAEHIGYEGKPAQAVSARMATVKQHIGRWDGDLTSPFNDLEKGLSYAYGLSHLAVSCLVQTYSENQLFTFFDLYIHRNLDITQAAQRAFGTPWTRINNDCADTIRRWVT